MRGASYPGVQDDQDLRVSCLPLTGGNKPFDDLTDLGGGHGRDISARLQPEGVQHGGPGGAAGLQRGHDRVRPAKDHSVLILTTAVGMAEGTVRAGRGVRPQPGRYIDGQDQPAVRRSRQRQAGQGPAEPANVDPPLVEPAVQGSVTPAVFWRERSVFDRALRAEEGVRQREQRVRATRETPVEARPELQQHGQRLTPATAQRTRPARPCPTSAWSRRGETSKP